MRKKSKMRLAAKKHFRAVHKQLRWNGRVPEDHRKMIEFADSMIEAMKQFKVDLSGAARKIAEFEASTEVRRVIACMEANDPIDPAEAAGAVVYLELGAEGIRQVLDE